jgi:hypothetical protein
MLQRVPQGLARAKATAPKVIEEVFSQVEQEIFLLIEKYPLKRELLQETLKKLPVYRKTYENDFPIDIWFQLINTNSLPGVRILLPTMSWIFLKTNKRCPFLTSDNPVFFFEWMGIGRLESEITFPISSTISLWATWQKNLAEDYLVSKESIVREINRRTASAATRYVYSSIENDGIVSLVNKKNYKLHRIK